MVKRRRDEDQGIHEENIGVDDQRIERTIEFLKVRSDFLSSISAISFCLSPLRMERIVA